jgi:PadR family transcriptional regulator, regulatory protein PadR
MSNIPKKEVLVLEILAATGPMHGLGLVAESGGALKRGTVYVTLGRMEAKGFVMSEQEPSHPGAIGLPRRIYRITPLGGRALMAWKTFTKELAWGQR